MRELLVFQGISHSVFGNHLNKPPYHPLVDEFVDLSNSQGQIDVFEFLANHPAADNKARLEVLLFDQARSWRDAEPRTVEFYCDRWPEIADDRELLLELALEEFGYLVDRGERPDVEEFGRRFPTIRDSIIAELEGFPFDSDLDDKLAATTDQVFTEETADHGTAAKRGDTAADSADSPIDSIGRYQVVTTLGKGGFGSVYLAFDSELQRQVAIKIPHAEHFGSDHDIERFLDEARTAAKLVHPGIVSVFDFGRTEDGRPYVVMQYISGQSLHQLMKARRLSSEESAHLLEQIAIAVAAAHKEGFVHRDLKPANILLNDEKVPWVSDFGLALHEEDQRHRAGELAGTLPYMAPEQVRGDVHRLDGRTDIWALGVMLYQMLTHRLPFGGDSAEQLSDEIQHREPKPPRQIDETIPAALESIVAKCCQKDVAARYSTALDVATDLRAYIEGANSAASVDTQVVGTTPRAEFGPARFLGVAVLVLLFAGFAATLGLRFTNPPDRRPDPQPNPQSAVVTTDLPLIDIHVWDKQNENRKGLSLHDPAARPLRKDDGVRVEARLPQAAYVYILWLDSGGKVLPVYPWTPGDWSPPQNEKKVTRVSLPEAADEAWPIEGEPGMETLIMLVRDTSLFSAKTLDLKSILQRLPQQAAQDPAALVEFVDGRVVLRRDRGPKLFDPQRINDPVLATQRVIQDQLSSHFRHIRAISFANGGRQP